MSRYGYLGSISESPLEFEITRVDCINTFQLNSTLSVAQIFHRQIYNRMLFLFFSIGYPVVTLGFGFKTYVSYKMRLVSTRD